VTSRQKGGRPKTGYEKDSGEACEKKKRSCWGDAGKTARAKRQTSDQTKVNEKGRCPLLTWVAGSRQGEKTSPQAGDWGV